MLKAKLAKLRRELITPKSQVGSGTMVFYKYFVHLCFLYHKNFSKLSNRKNALFFRQGGSAAQDSFEVAKTGDSRIGFVGE
jgi:ribosome-interacting GTPase 1